MPKKGEITVSNRDGGRGKEEDTDRRTGHC